MKEFFSTLLLTILFGSLYAQDNQIYERYRPEPGQTFKFAEFQRGFDPEIVHQDLQQLQQKEKVNWTVEDSILFAKSLLKVGRPLKSAIVFNKIPSPFIRDKETLKFKLMAFEKTQKYGLALSLIEELSIRFPEDKIQWNIWARMIKARTILKNDEKPDFQKNGLLDLYQLRNVDEDALQRYLAEVNELLHFQIHFYEDQDKVLAQLCYEFGIILRDRVAYTQAYIALNLARNYDRSLGGDILKTLKEVKAYLNQNRYKIPPFRRYFPKTKKWRFDYEILKEKKLAQSKDTLLEEKEPIQMMQPPEKEKDLLPYNRNLLFGGVFLIMLILVLVFVRSKKN